MKTDLYLDCEWQLNQEIFLIGYAFNLKDYGQLYGYSLNKSTFKQLLRKVTGRIYIYGPDIGMVEKFFKMKIRENYHCINLIKVFRDCMPGLKSYQLDAIERKFGIHRKTQRYKKNIFKLFTDWYKPKYRVEILKYNMDDVINLVKIKLKVFSAYTIPSNYFIDVRLR